MDAKEAIYRIQKFMVDNRLYEPEAALINEALNTAIKALAEQEPVKPKPYYLWGEKSEKMVLCGACGEGKIFIHEYYNYCPVCGRKVDWDAIR